MVMTYEQEYGFCRTEGRGHDYRSHVTIGDSDQIHSMDQGKVQVTETADPKRAKTVSTVTTLANSATGETSIQYLEETGVRAAMRVSDGDPGATKGAIPTKNVKFLTRENHIKGFSDQSLKPRSHECSRIACWWKVASE
jgi:hypothetical protein